MMPPGCTHWKQGFDDAVLHYQRSQYDAALKECKERRVAVDAGAHVGIFTKRMLEDFKHVIAFEPIPSNFDCLKHNCRGAMLYDCGLSSAFRNMRMRLPTVLNSGSWEEHEDGELYADAIDLDRLHIENLDLFKLDIQGGEVAALRGAEQTIRRCKPVILIEMSGELHSAEIKGILYRFGYRLRRTEGDDQVWVAE